MRISLLNTIRGTAGDDDLAGDPDRGQILRGLGGNERLLDSYLSRNAPDTGQDTLLGGAGDDSLSSRGGRDLLKGGDGDDFLSAFEPGKLIGGRGNDMFSVQGTDANDQTVLVGGAGFDTARFTVAVDTDQVVDVTTGGTLVFANAMRVKGIERFQITTGAGDDVIMLSDDSVDTGAIALQGDFADGGAGNDVIYGLGGNDHLIGGDGHDTLYGGDGGDRLQGEGGDALIGGAGGDVFVFKTDFDAAREADRITDFNLGDGDRLHLTRIFDDDDFLSSVVDPFADGLARLTDLAEGTLIEVRERGVADAEFQQLVLLEQIGLDDLGDGFFV